MKVMNIKTRPSHFSDMLVGNFGELVNEFLQEDKITSNIAFRPAIELKEEKDVYKLDVALPGIKKEEISIEVENDYLTIKGERVSSSNKETNKTHVSEFKYGKFERKILLPKNAEYNKINAKYEDGLLKVEVAKREEAKAKSIEIK
jgi:HSP20 family protein